MSAVAGYRWRLLVGVVFAMLIVMLIVMLAPVAGASAAPTQSPGVAMAIGDCKDAPMPKAPIGLLGDSTKPEIVRPASSDPFTNTDVPLASVYGWQYRWISYDTGCKPGSGFLPSAGANISNWITEPIGGMAGAGHAIHSSVLNPTWLDPLDVAVENGVREVRSATWTPYVGLSIVIVVVIMLWAARSGRLDGTVTAAIWAIVVMSVVTFLGSYPTESTDLMDGAITESAGLISTSFSDRDPEKGQVMVQSTIDRQWDEILRTTALETWANGTFGSAESATAKKYGPAIFTSTHLSWDEWDAVQEDPEGEGKDIIEKKQKAFDEAAEKIQDSDPYAYNHLTGNEWGSRLATASVGVVGAALAMLFLLVAGIGMFVGFITIRVAIMFAPAAGVIFLIEKTRHMAIGLLAKVGKYIILGPIYLLAGLIVLKLIAAIASSEALAWWLQLLLFFVVSFVAWSLTRPTGGIPGFNGLRKVMRIATGTLLGIQLSGRGKDDPAKKSDGTSEDEDEDDTSDNDRPVKVTRERPRALEHQRMLALEASPQLEDEDGDIPSHTATFAPAAAALSSRRNRELSGSKYPAALSADNSSQTSQVVALGPGRADPGAGSVPVQGSTQPALVGGLAVVAEPDDADAPEERVDGRSVTGSTAAAGTVGGANTTNGFDPSADLDDGPSSQLGDHRDVVVVRPTVQRANGATLEGDVANVDGDDESASGGSTAAPATASSSAPGNAVPTPSPAEVAAMAEKEGSMTKQPIVGKVLDDDVVIDPDTVSEANLTYDSQNRPVYTVYRPAGRSVSHRAE